MEHDGLQSQGKLQEPAPAGQSQHQEASRKAPYFGAVVTAQMRLRA